ncbi:MAC/perforin domain-containing protein [Bacteroides fragilis]|nr:MAC/perforin domain-containing protein [Bacteroides fragilis]
MFNLSVDGHYDQTLVKDNSEQEIVYRTEGGDPSRALIGQLNYDSKNPSVIDISSWQQSCDDNNMTLVDAEPGSLIPIYDLVSDMGKKEQLKLAVENYLKEHSYVDIDDSSKGGAVRNNSRGHNTSSYGNSTRVIGANGNRSTYRRP